ncbi:hypothetical protein D6779_02000 [Candidatus Parcubacteria bacterium]|nr:MAG: hypothetical protein D6779_02000 [Candidatus Parcubacteria bacterium]
MKKQGGAALNNSQRPLTARIKRWFDNGTLGKWTYFEKKRDHKFILFMIVKGKGDYDLNFIADIQDDEEQVIFYSMIDDKAPEERRQAVAEFLTRANYGLRIGNFEMDFNDGEIRYKTSLDITNLNPDQVTDEMIAVLVTANLQTMNRYYPGIKKVIDGKEPAACIAEIEGDI